MKWLEWFVQVPKTDREETFLARESWGMVLEGFSYVFVMFLGDFVGSMASSWPPGSPLPESPPDLETNKKLPEGPRSWGLTSSPPGPPGLLGGPRTSQEATGHPRDHP